MDPSSQPNFGMQPSNPMPGSSPVPEPPMAPVSDNPASTPATASPAMPTGSTMSAGAPQPIPTGAPASQPTPQQPTAPRPDFQPSPRHSSGDIVLVPDRGSKKSKLPLIIGIILAIVTILGIMVVIITTNVSNSRKQNLKEAATTLVANEKNLSAIDSIFVAVSNDELRLDGVMTENFYNGFEKSVEEYGKLCEQVCDLEVGNSSSEAEAAHSAIEKIKSRNAYYSDTFNIYANFYKAFVKNDESAKKALSEHSNNQVKELYQELSSMVRTVEDLQKQGIESGCNDVAYSTATGTCRELMDQYKSNRDTLVKSTIMNKVFTASEYYNESLLPAEESEMHSLIDAIRSLNNEE